MLRSRFADSQSFEWLPVFEEFEYQWASTGSHETAVSLRWRTRADGRAGVVTEKILGGPFNRSAVRRQLRHLKRVHEAADARK
jgi:hypothetical protein